LPFGNSVEFCRDTQGNADWADAADLSVSIRCIRNIRVPLALPQTGFEGHKKRNLRLMAV
jgi:hypothetical protein